MQHFSPHSFQTKGQVSIHNILTDQLDRYLKKMLHPANSHWTGAIIIGKAGSGKTFLVENYLERIKGCDVLVSKQSQQLQNVSYAGFKQAFQSYFLKKFKEMDSSEFSAFSIGLKEALGEDFRLLSEYLPELNLLGSQEVSAEPSQLPKVENQLYYIFKTLCEYLSEYSGKTLLLFTDDLQWMDSSSANLLQFLLSHLSPAQLLWLGAARDQKEDLDQVNQLISTLSSGQKHIQRIELGAFNISQSKLFIEEYLKGQCEPKTVSLLHSLGQGNPTFLSVLLESLLQEEYIFFEGGRWKGSYKKIKARYQKVNSAQIFLKRLAVLSEPSRNVIELLSSVGSLSAEDLKVFGMQDGQIDLPLQELLREGIVLKKAGRIQFSESYYSEIIYSRITDAKKSALHYQIAKSLLRHDFASLHVREKVLVAQHLQLASSNINSDEERIQAAYYNLEVGKIQKQENALAEAKRFLKAATHFIKGVKWKAAESLLFQVYMESARIEYLLGEYDLAEIQLDYLIENLRTCEYRAESFELKIIINNHLGRYRKVVFILKEILLELDVHVPESEQDLLSQIELLQINITKNDCKEIDFLSSEVDRQAAILRLLYVGGMAMHHTSEVLMTWAALQIISRSQEYNLPNAGTIGYVSYGRMLIISGLIEEGVAFGKRGLELNSKLGDRQYRCRVLGVYAFYILPWKRPFNQSTALLLEGMEFGRRSGDLIGLYILKTHLFNLDFISGKPLSLLLEYEFKESYIGMELTYYITRYQKEFIQYLMGGNPFLSLPKPKIGGLAANLTLAEEKFYRNYVLAQYYFLFGYFDQAILHAKDADRNKKLQQGSPLVPANLLLLALAITQNWQNLNPSEYANQLSLLKEILRKFEIWKSSSEANFSSSYWLIKAEIGRVSGSNKRIIEEDFQQAILSAKGNLFLQAVAHELYCVHKVTYGEEKKAELHLQLSKDFYKEWGAKRKVQHLKTKFAYLYNKKKKKASDLDMESILREMGGDLHADIISKKLLTILLRVSASSRAKIHLMQSEGHLGEPVELKQVLFPRRSSPGLDEVDLSGLFLMAFRTRSPLIFDDLVSEDTFPELKRLYKAGVQSSMIFPIGISESLTIIVYLESSFRKANYSSEVVRWVRIIGSQGGILLDNARSYERSIILHQEVKAEMEQKQHLMNLIEQQKNSHIKDLVKIQEHERERIAGELHDSLGSQLSTVKVRLAGLFEQYENIPIVQEGMKSLQKLDVAIDEVRRIAHNMSPVALRKFGLSSALVTMLDDINNSSKIEVELQILGLEERLDEQIELTVYRICQELIQNTLKHAQADQVRVQLINHKNVLNITVEDNGIGIQEDRMNWGMGLLGIETKVNMLNGNFEIESKPQKGCLIVIDITL